MPVHINKNLKVNKLLEFVGTTDKLFMKINTALASLIH